MIPNVPSIHWELVLPTRIFEYSSLEKAVIAPSTKDIRYYFDDESLYLFEAREAESLAQVILKIYRNPERLSSAPRGSLLTKSIAWNYNVSISLDRQKIF